MILLCITPIVAAMEAPTFAISCHCFKDRSYDPKKKFTADKYLLTTSFNSFIAAVFHISKREIVMMKMKGSVPPDDLLIGLYIASVSGIELNTLLAILNNGATWEQILESPNLNTLELNNKGIEEIRPVINNKEKTVERITDQLVHEYFGVAYADITSLREEGANDREITLLYLLEKYANPGHSATEILAMHIKDGKSWGEIVHSLGLTPKETGRLIPEVVIKSTT